MKKHKTRKDKNSKQDGGSKRKDKQDYPGLILKFFKVSAFVLLVTGVGMVAYLFFGYLYTSSYFKLQEIIVNGEKRLSEIEVLNLARIDVGSNILVIGLREISERIEQHPWIEHAVVKRRLPQRIVIDIIERVPAAKVNFDRLYLVDEKGVIFKEVGPEDLFDIPVLTWLEPEGLASDEDVSKMLIEKALDVLDDIKKRTVLGVNEVSEINMDPRRGLTLFTAKDATLIKLGFGDYEKKLNNLKKVLADLYTKDEKVEYINLIYDKKVYVKLDKPNSPQTLVALREGRAR